jgi:hypothetical protein
MGGRKIDPHVLSIVKHAIKQRRELTFEGLSKIYG